MFFHPQPYYATRVNAADIENRVQELNKKSLSEETSKAGFWEEFDVRSCWGPLFWLFWEVLVHHSFSIPDFFLDTSFSGVLSIYL